VVHVVAEEVDLNAERADNTPIDGVAAEDLETSVGLGA